MKALIFPGQGSQTIGMGQKLAQQHPACIKFFDTASEKLGFDLTQYIWQECEEFQRTDVVQAAIFTVSCAMLSLVDFDFAMVAGHSLGEYAALYAAKHITFEEGIELIQKRGAAMNRVCQQIDSGMLACLGDGNVAALAAESGCEIANYNSSTQTVLSGLTANINKAQELAKEFNFTKAIILNTAGAYHSSLMQPSADEFAQQIEQLHFTQSSNVQVIANATARPVENVKQNMIDQITSPVMWKQSLNWMTANGISQFIEIGHGTVLTKMLQRDGFNASKFAPEN